MKPAKDVQGEKKRFEQDVGALCTTLKGYAFAIQTFCSSKRLLNKLGSNRSLHVLAQWLPILRGALGLNSALTNTLVLN